MWRVWRRAQPDAQRSDELETAVAGPRQVGPRFVADEGKVWVPAMDLGNRLVQRSVRVEVAVEVAAHADDLVVDRQRAAGHDFVITAQESNSDGDSFDLLRAQLRTHIRRPMPSTADLLAHALLDAVVDEYFPVLEQFGEALYSLEDEVITAKDQSVLGRIQGARRDVATLRRALWPLRDALFMLGREGFSLGAEARLYLRDTTDHLLRIIDIAEGYRETVASLMELSVHATESLLARARRRARMLEVRDA